MNLEDFADLLPFMLTFLATTLMWCGKVKLEKYLDNKEQSNLSYIFE